jgi:hypothetical protein
MMMTYRYDEKTEDGVIKCLFIDFLIFRILFAYSTSRWYSKHHKRQRPIYLSRKGFFIHKLGIRAGIQKQYRKGA